MPERFRSIFEFAKFNPMQSKSFDTIFNTDLSCVISSPTGSGKTALFELAIVKLLNHKLQAKDDSFINAKILYMAPTKALCTERHDDWSKKLRSLNCTVGMLTGDSTLAELDSVKKSTLIICTPEKWDVLTRRWSDYSKLLDLVKLLLVDEIHFIKERRGTTLEVVITRLMTMSLNLRILALSATVPNISDITKWLQSNHSNSIKTMVYGEKYRSVQLNKIVYGYKNAGTNNSFQLDVYYNKKLKDVIDEHSKKKPILIFCPTRNSTVKTAKFLAEEILQNSINPIDAPYGISKEILELASKGLAYHNAGLSLPERRFVETNFINGNIKILCSTSTLAVGVNLPAYLVIIKGTQAWNNNCMEEYNELDVLQMMGRAGRPQFEQEGCCVILTDGSHREKYNKLVTGTENLESSLHLNIFENITAEIQLQTIISLETAFNWLKSTFFYQRYLQNPTVYTSVFSKVNASHPLEVQLKIFLKQIIDELIEEKIITFESKVLKCTVYGQTLSKSYVLYETIKLLIKSIPKISLKDALKLVSKSSEFEDFKIKYNQRRIYKEINLNPLILDKCDPTKLDTYWAKTSLIIQFELGGLEFPVFQGSIKFLYEFRAEKSAIFKNLPRILKAAIEIYSHKKDAISTKSILKLNRSIAAKSWENTYLVLKQFDGVGVAYAKKLRSHGITTISQIKSLPREKLEQYIGLKPGSGQKLVKCILSLPDLLIKVENIKCQNDGTVEFEVNPYLANAQDSLSYVWNGNYTTVYILIESSGEIIDFRQIPLRKLLNNQNFVIKHKLKNKLDFVKVYYDAETICGIGKVIDVNFNNAKNSFHNENVSNFICSEDEFSDSIDFHDFSVDQIASNSKADRAINNAEIRNLDYKTTLNPSNNTDSDVFKCNHKCGNKKNCRHICCKEGIHKTKTKGCKHTCKDKGKCRHMCCRDQYEYEQNIFVKQSKKDLKQKTLNIDSFKHGTVKPITVKDNINSGVCYTDIECRSEPISNIEHTKVQTKSSEIPIFLKNIQKDVETATLKNILPTLKPNNGATFASLGASTSKYFNFVADPKHYPKSLLDEPVENCLEGTLDETLDDFLNSGKRLKPLSSKNPKKRQKMQEVIQTSKESHVKSQNNNYKSTRRPAIPEPIKFGSVEDILIFNHSLPTVVSVKSMKRNEGIADLCKMQESESTIESADTFIKDHNCTADTSLIEEWEEKNKVLNFLDSDIEY